MERGGKNMNAEEYNLAIMFYYIKQEIGNLDEARQKMLTANSL